MGNRLVRGVVTAANAGDAAAPDGPAAAVELLEVAATRRPAAGLLCRAINQRGNAARATIGAARDLVWCHTAVAIEVAVGPAAQAAGRELLLVLCPKLFQAG